MKRKIRFTIDIMLMMLILPLLGMSLAKKPVAEFMEFPPLTRYVVHAGFSWVVFVLLAIAITAFVGPFVIRVLRCRNSVDKGPSSVCAFPWWGWLGILITVLTWTAAWTRFEWMAPVQIFTFTPIWIGYIVVVNALTYKRTGKCMLLDRPLYLCCLSLMSAAFWWYFEYLNRFVQNWYYVGIGRLTGLQYFIFATLPFATVLPAVLSTFDLLSSMPGASAGLDDFVKIRVGHPRTAAWVSLLVFSASLTAIGLFPDYLFPLLWISPLFIITSLHGIRGEKTIFSGVAVGDWRQIWMLALSALICGFFWELWNFHSLAKWIYEVPFVGRFKIFEMPVLGFAGYLPFGLECAVVAGLFKLGASDNREESLASDKPLYPLLRLANLSKIGNTLIMLFLVFSVFVGPVIVIWSSITDQKFSGEGIPGVTWRLHKKITPKYAYWAIKRVESGVAANLPLYDVPSTEWPMFGSVFYLWSTEALQKAWEKDNSLAREAPAVYAHDAIEASLNLVLDPVHHTWVKQHWGDDYMHKENVFFRSLIIAAIISHENMLGTGAHLDLLRDQVESLSAELDASPYGILEDYPQECYPIDVFMAIAVIKRADVLLGTDHSKFVERAARAFEGDMLDDTGLIPYFADSKSGRQLAPSRGIGNSHILIYAHELWPEKAKEWYARYEEHFWQDEWWASGFREYPKSIDYFDWSYDVDAGPIIAGFSPAGNAFGVAAAKINGRLDHAYTLSAQVFGACLPMLNGRLLGPMLLSDWEHAPYLGEVSMIYLLSQTPADGVEIVKGGFITPALYIGSAIFLTLAALFVFLMWVGWRGWKKKRQSVQIKAQKTQFMIWLLLVCIGLVMLFTGHLLSAAALFAIGQAFPVYDEYEVSEKEGV